MLRILFFTSVLFIARPSFPDTGGWAATYGGAGEDWAAAIRQTGDGGYIVAGWTASFSTVNGDLWVLKLRADGAVEWQKAYGGASSDFAASIQQTDDGGYIVVGETRSFGVGEADMWVLKLKPNGTVEWQKTYGGTASDKAASIQQTHDRGYVVAGMTQSFGAGDYDAWILKLTPDGSIEWQKTYGGGGMDAAHSIRQTGDGGYIVAGCTSSFGTGRGDFWVLKLRPDGTLEWQKTYGGDDSDEAHSIQQTRDGGYIVAGTTSSFGAGEGDLWVLKLKSDGIVKWQTTCGGDCVDGAVSIQETGDEGYIVAGVKDELPAGGGDLWVLKIRSEGSVKWQKVYGGAGWEWATSIQQTTEGGYIVAGLTSSFGTGGFDSWVLKLRPDGSIHPSCGFVWNIIAPETGSNAAILDTSASIKDSYVNPQDSSAMILDTDVSAEVQCPAAPYYYGKPL